MSALHVVSVQGYAGLQDGGRAGRAHEGIPPGGPLCRALAARANAAVGNDDRAPVIELVGRIRLRAEGAVTVADHAGRPRELPDGAEITFDAPREFRAGYIAVAGAFDVPLLFGGRGALLALGAAELPARALSRGDRLAVGAGRAAAVAPAAALPDVEGPVRVIPGPDLGELPAGALEALFAGDFTVGARSDRTGARLEGGRVPSRSAEASSRPMVVGAIQVPPDGAPIVLGPDGPTTGGYPVVAVLAASARDGFFGRHVGKPVKFTAGS